MGDSRNIPLCVDLDGTLARTDLLWEAMLAYARSHPLRALGLPFQLVRGKAGFKLWLAARVTLDIERLPLREPLVQWLREEASAGRTIVLATASPLEYAERVSRRLGFVSRVFATSAGHNLKGPAKAEALSEAFGRGGFDYVGDCDADIPVWRESRSAMIVDNGKGLAREWLRAIRLHQWLKNLLLAVPLLAAHRFTDPGALVSLALAILAFSLVASSAYVANDMLDVEADRRHPGKSRRPFAAGTIPLAQGALGAAVLLCAGATLSLAMLPMPFTLILGVYFLATCLYSTTLKQWAIVDVAVLAGLYVLRVIAGAAAVDVPVSFWLLAFSLFLFFSLALAKRYTELAGDETREAAEMGRRGYRTSDLPLLQSVGVASGFIAIMVMALYINSPESQALYRRPPVLWMVIPALLLWVSRLWLLARRGELHEDPVVYALTDRGSLLLGAATIAAVVAAI